MDSRHAAAVDATLDNFLHRLPVMVGLEESALQFLGNLAGEERFAAGAVIVREGDPGDRVFFVCEGKVRVVKGHGTPHPVPLAEMGPGDYFGEMSLVESVARSASVVAVEPVRAFTLKGINFYKLYREQPDQYGIVVLNIARDLARRLRRLDERFVAVSH
ncbi:MAG TPA: cyclic nucleotide-binding domain-containing protein [Opitutaceae bacterium]|nr:cyclic nucleotide-binding domain-containing protein [Opitutaceae bacterium]